MAKTLLLMRHGKSSWKDKSLPDKQRPLKKRGAVASAIIGEVLKENELTPQLILSSPAKRAKQTAEIVSKVCNFPGKIEFVDSFYMGEPQDFYARLLELNDEIERIMIVAHNPGLEALMQMLDGKVDALPTGAMAYIGLELNHWADLKLETNGELIGFWEPESIQEHELEEEMGKDKKEKKDKKVKKEKKEKKEKKDKK